MDVAADTLEGDARLRRTLGLVAQTTPLEATARAAYDSRWRWVVRSYQGTRFRMETVHATEASMAMEVRAIESLGRNADVWRLSDKADLYRGRVPVYFGGRRC